MKKLLRISLIMLSMAATPLMANENSLGSIFQPLDGLSDGAVAVREVPFVFGGEGPEAFFEAISRPHVPQQQTSMKVGDINLASRAGVRIAARIEGVEDQKSKNAGRYKLIIGFDFSKAHADRVDATFVRALVECVRKTAGDRVIHSEVIAGDKFPEAVKIIQAAIAPKD